MCQPLSFSTNRSLKMQESYILCLVSVSPKQMGKTTCVVLWRIFSSNKSAAANRTKHLYTHRLPENEEIGDIFLFNGSVLWTMIKKFSIKIKYFQTYSGWWHNQDLCNDTILSGRSNLVGMVPLRLFFNAQCACCKKIKRFLNFLLLPLLPPSSKTLFNKCEKVSLR